MRPHRKLCSLERLLALRQEARDAGQIVVHCHGCFDIVHPGHIHHLEFARSLGDRLVVSVSADAQINKGVNRPLIPDDLRAASLAALECVDWVHVDEHPTAVELLEMLRPDVYVKGREYERNSDPRFLAERDTVLRHGGRVIFSGGEVVYSSTALIASLEDTESYDQEKLQRYRQRHGLTSERLCELVRGFAGRRVLVIGDYLLERDLLCDARGLAGDAPALSLRLLRQRESDGGASMVALHAAALGAATTLFASMGDDEAAGRAQMRLSAAGVVVHAPADRRQTSSRHRYVVDSARVLEVDEGSPAPVDAARQQRLAERILTVVRGAAAVVFVDLGHGTITPGLVEMTLPELRQRVPVVCANIAASTATLTALRGIDVLCGSERQLRRAMQDSASALPSAVWNLMKLADARSAIVSLGRQGVLSVDRNVTAVQQQRGQYVRSEYLPAVAAAHADLAGSEHAMLTTAALTLCAGGSLEAAAYLGTLAAAAGAQRIGGRPVSAEMLLTAVSRQEGRALVRLAS